MKPLRMVFSLVLCLLLDISAFAFQASTPEGALEEMATTDKLEVFARHLPVPIQEEINKLDGKDKVELSERLLVRKLMETQGLAFTKLEDGITWEVRKAKTQRVGSAKVKNSFLSGVEAFVMLELTDERESSKEEQASNTESAPNTESPPNTEPAPGREKQIMMMLVSMRLQDGDWRVTGFGPWQQRSLESADFLGLLHRGGHGELPAASTLRMLITVLVLYRDTYPQVGLPANLAALAGPEGTEPSAEHAMLLDPSFTATPLIKDGYEFRYTLIDPGIQKGSEARYRITVTPIGFGQSDVQSFFADQTGVIRFTTQHREADESDPPLHSARRID